ncbi:MAG: hypothetical protein WKG07_22330 [Hymenobacter sp.]
MLASFGYRAYSALFQVPEAPVFATVLLPAGLDLFALGALLRLHTAAARAHLGQVADYPAGRRRRPGCYGPPVGRVRGKDWPASSCVVVVYPTLGAGAGYLTLRWLMRSPPQTRWLAHPLAQWLGPTQLRLLPLPHLMLPVFYQRLVFYFVPAGAGQWRDWLVGPLPTVLVFTPILYL